MTGSRMDSTQEHFDVIVSDGIEPVAFEWANLFPSNANSG